MTQQEALQAVCDELGITMADALSWLDFAFTAAVDYDSTKGFELNRTAKLLSVGERKFRSFVRCCERHGLLTSVEIFVPASYLSTLRALSTSALGLGSSLERALPESTEDTSDPNPRRSKEEGSGEKPFRNLDFLVSSGLYAAEAELPTVDERQFVTKEEDFEVRKAKAEDAKEWEAKARAAYEQLWFPDLVQRILTIHLDEVASREISWQVVLHTFYEPVLRLQGKFHIDRDLIESALELTISKNIGNVMYAVAVAKAEQKRRLAKKADNAIFENEDKQKVFYTENGVACGALDTWALDDPRYRDAYIACFGLPKGCV